MNELLDVFIRLAFQIRNFEKTKPLKLYNINELISLNISQVNENLNKINKQIIKITENILANERKINYMLEFFVCLKKVSNVENLCVFISKNNIDLDFKNSNRANSSFEVNNIILSKIFNVKLINKEWNFAKKLN